MIEYDLLNCIVWLYQTIFWIGIIAYQYDNIQYRLLQWNTTIGPNTLHNLVKITIDMNHYVFLLGLIGISATNIILNQSHLFHWIIFWSQSYCVFHILYQGYHSELGEITIYMFCYIYIHCMSLLEPFYQYQSYLLLLYGCYLLTSHIMTCLYDYHRRQYILKYHYLASINHILKDSLFYTTLIYCIVLIKWMYDQAYLSNNR